MSSLSHLRAALRQANSGSLHGLAFDTKSMVTEEAKLRHWLGDRGSAKPPQDAIVAALRAFFQNHELESRRQALLVCFGCVDPVLPAGARLIEDGERFPKLLQATDTYLPNPRAFRPCYRGLLNAYFVYDADTAQSAGRQNWEQLRAYLRKRAANTVASGLLPAWVDALQANIQLLGTDPGESYGHALLNGQSEEFDRAREALDINDNSWLIWRLVLGQVDAASRRNDPTFQKYLPNLLDLLARHPLAINDGLAKILDRYRASSTITVHADLRDFAVARWGNPWLAMNKAKWSLVKDEARAMVAGWLKLVLIQQFFSLLAADGTNDTRRLRFWERYHDSIDDMYFALGSSARWHRGADFKDIRKKMEGRLLNLHSAGPPDNNAFIMCIGNYVVVEFGLSGNACFIFRRDNLPFELKGEIAGNSTALKHQACVERILHIDKNSGKWERQFQRALASLMQVQPAQPSMQGATQSRVLPSATASAPTSHPTPAPMRLLVGHPDRAGEALGHRFTPEHQNIDAAIWLAVVPEWPGDPTGGMFCVPRLEPRANALFQLFDDAARNAGVEVGFSGRHDFSFPLEATPCGLDAGQRGRGASESGGAERGGVSPACTTPYAGAEGWGHREPGEALALKRRGAPQDCAGSRLLGRLRKGMKSAGKAPFSPNFYGVVVEFPEAVSRLDAVNGKERQRNNSGDNNAERPKRCVPERVRG